MARKKEKITKVQYRLLTFKFPPLPLVLLGLIFTLLLNFNQVKASNFPDNLPSLNVHPLPLPLQTWQDLENQGDYFPEIKPTKLGYLIWSQFPVKVFLDKPTEDKKTSASAVRFHQWTESVREGIKQWEAYFPLEEVEAKETADIIIQYQAPPTETKLNPTTGLYDISPARAAQTRYQLYLKGSSQILAHRMTIDIKPGQSPSAILAATRHEFGHALGIWGHSRVQTDALYFSQVREAPLISPRDINTLKKIYQQPTRLGWELLSQAK